MDNIDYKAKVRMREAGPTGSVTRCVPLSPSADVMERRMAVLSYAELFEGKHEIVCSATPEGLEVRPTGDSRSTGLFATRWFRRGDLLYAGEALLLPDEPGSLVVHTVGGGDCSFDIVTHCAMDHTVGKRYFYAGIDGYMNHACEPNAASIPRPHRMRELNLASGDSISVEGYDQVVLQDIGPGEEITCDYDMYEWDCRDKVVDPCMCGSVSCRGRSWGFRFLPEKTQRRMIGAAADLWDVWQEHHPEVLLCSLEAAESVRISACDCDGVSARIKVAASRPLAPGALICESTSLRFDAATVTSIVATFAHPDTALDSKLLLPQAAAELEVETHSTSCGDAAREFKGICSLVRCSDRPNAKLSSADGDGTQKLFALRAIAEGEELTTSSPTPAHGFAVLLSAVCINFACSFAVSAAFPTLPLEAKRWQRPLGEWLVGSILSITAASYLLACVFASVAASRLGCKRLALAGIGASTIATAAFGLTTQPVVLFGARLLLGIGTAAAEVGMLALAAARCPQGTGRLVSLVEVAQGIGWVIGPLVAGAGLEILGFCGVFIACSAICFSAGLVCASALARVADTKEAEKWPDLWAVGQPPMLSTVAAVAVFSSTVGLLLANVTLHFSSAALPEVPRGLLITLLAGAYIAAGPYVGHLADRVDGCWLMRCGLYLGAAGFALLSLPAPQWLPHWSLPALGMAGIGVAEALAIIPAFPVLLLAARQSNLGEVHAAALSSAAFNAAWSVGEAAGPMLGVWPIGHWGFRNTMAACAATCCLAAALTTLRATPVSVTRRLPLVCGVTMLLTAPLLDFIGTGSGPSAFRRQMQNANSSDDNVGLAALLNWPWPEDYCTAHVCAYGTSKASYKPPRHCRHIHDKAKAAAEATAAVSMCKGYPSLQRYCREVSLKRNFSLLQDKVGVKEIIASWVEGTEMQGRLVPIKTYLVVERPRGIKQWRVDRLPERYVFKRSHGTGGVVLVTGAIGICIKLPCLPAVTHSNGSHVGGRFHVTLQSLRILCHKWLSGTGGRDGEGSYKYIRRRCLFEEALDTDGGFPTEIQVWVVGSRPMILRHDYEMGATHNAAGVAIREKPTHSTHVSYVTSAGEFIPGLEVMYDFEVTPPPIQATAQCGSTAAASKVGGSNRPLPIEPETLKALLRFSTLAAKKADSLFFRVDVYVRNPRQLIFGELTMTPMACEDMFVPVALDMILGAAMTTHTITSSAVGRVVSNIICQTGSPYLNTDLKVINEKNLKMFRSPFSESMPFRAGLFKHDLQSLRLLRSGVLLR